MSVSVMSLVWGSTLRDRTQVDVLNYLANCGDDEGGNCFPGVLRIARMTRCSERTVVRAIADLEKGGWVTVDRGNGRRHRSEFQINVAQLKECQDVTLSQGKKRVTPATQRVTPAAEKGDIGDNPPHPLLGRNVSETSENRTVATASRPRAVLGISAAVDQVMRGCGFTARRLRLKLRAVVMQQSQRTDTLRQFITPDEIAAGMIDAWMRYGKQGTRLFRHVSAAEFFEEGLWLNSNTWHWDGDAIKQERLMAEARTGSYQ